MKATTTPLAKQNINRKSNPAWHRGSDCNVFPQGSDLKSASSNFFFLGGVIPTSPFLSKQDGVLAFGSCFAQNISGYLERNGYKVLGREGGAFLTRLSSAMTTTFSVRQYLEWVYDKASMRDLFLVPNAPLQLDSDSRTRMQGLFANTKLVIITLGLSEVWFDKSDGHVFWRGVPEKHYDKDAHGFRVSSVFENIENLKVILALLQENVPQASIVITLSPIPLLATFRPINCIVANSVSKAVLRVAIDEVYRLQPDRFYYWPSYEMVTGGRFEKPFAADQRHLRAEVESAIMGMFVDYFYLDS